MSSMQQKRDQKTKWGGGGGRAIGGVSREGGTHSKNDPSFARKGRGLPKTQF